MESNLPVDKKELQKMLNHLSELTKMEYPSVDELDIESCQKGGKFSKKKIQKSIQKIERILKVKFPHINKIIKELNQSGGLPLETVNLEDISIYLQQVNLSIEQINEALETARQSSQTLSQRPNAQSEQIDLSSNLLEAIDNIQNSRNIHRNIELLLPHIRGEPSVKSTLLLVRAAINEYIEAEKANEAGEVELAGLQIQSIQNVVGAGSPIVSEPNHRPDSKFRLEELKVMSDHNIAMAKIQANTVIEKAKLDFEMKKLVDQTELEKAKLELEKSKLEFQQTSADLQRQFDMKKLEVDKTSAVLQRQFDMEKLEAQRKSEEAERMSALAIAQLQHTGNLEQTNKLIEHQKAIFNERKKTIDELQKKITYEENKSAIIIGRLQILLLLIFSTLSGIIFYMSATDVNQYTYFLNIIKRFAYPFRETIIYLTPDAREINMSLQDMSPAAGYFALFLNSLHTVCKVNLSNFLWIITVIGRFILTKAASAPVFLSLTYLLIGILIILVLGRFKYKPKVKTIVSPTLDIPDNLLRSVLDPLNQHAPLSN